MGSIALYPVPFFFFPRSLGHAATRFSARALTVRAYKYLFPLGMRVTYSIRARRATRKVNYIMRARFRAIATVSNVSRRGILNILRAAIFFSFSIVTVNGASRDSGEGGGGDRPVYESLRLQFTAACRAILFFPLPPPPLSLFAASYGRRLPPIVFPPMKIF